MKKAIVIFILLFFCFGGVSLGGLLRKVTLEWDANTESNLKGYKIYYGPDKSLSNSVDVGNVTTYTIEISSGTYIAATAYGECWQCKDAEKTDCLESERTYYVCESEKSNIVFFVDNQIFPAQNLRIKSTFVQDVPTLILMSETTNRKDGVSLDGQNVSGVIYIYLADDSAIKKATFYLDGKPYRVENVTPFDFNGTDENFDPVAFNTAELLNGQHEVKVAVEGDRSFDIKAVFTVEN